jgi:hypothetical protein
MMTLRFPVTAASCKEILAEMYEMEVSDFDDLTFEELEEIACELALAVGKNVKQYSTDVVSDGDSSDGTLS